jgi:hypothetical protein
MRSTYYAAIAASLFGANVLANEGSASSTSDSLRVVQYPIQRKAVVNPIEQDRKRLARRQGTVNVPLTNEETLYFMNATIGTPPQYFQLHLDTGSSDLWVNVRTSSFCRANSAACGQSGFYNANSSSTYQYINSQFTIKYKDGSGSSGDYVSDTVSFGSATLTNQQFGIGYKSSAAQSILGIGYPLLEVATQYYGGQPYANIPQNLADQGFISTNAYSLWLNDLDANLGSILFGGVDRSKYMGELQTLPIIKTQGLYVEFTIALTALGANGNTGTIASNIAVPVLLDSGTSLTYLPSNLANAIFQTVGGSSSTQGVQIVDCALGNSDATIDFTFSGVTIKVALNELVFINNYDRRGQPICVLGILSGDGTAILGDTFLRSAYVVYDLANNQISLAQTNFNTTSSNIQEITANGGVPGATVVPNAVATGNTSGGQGRINGNPTITITGAAQPTAAPAYNMALVGALAGGLVMAAM